MDAVGAGQRVAALRGESALKIVNVVGTRPNLMKIAPLAAEMCHFPDIKPVLVHTGQHYDDNMSKVFFQDLDIPQPDYNLEIGSGSHTWQTAQVMLALEPLLQDLHPDLVLVVGDVNSTLAAALVAAKQRIPLVHVEAGLRSFDRTMPEEINRVVTDALADYLFTTERSANENLRREGIPDSKVFFVGNVMIDTLLRHRKCAEALQMPARYSVRPDGYALLTLHRPSNVDMPEVLSGILDALTALQDRLPVLFPVHPRTLKRFEETGLLERAQALPNLRFMEPLGYLEFLGLLAQARLVLTDSGGIQEETTILGVPCLTLRENTERPVTISEGTNELVGTTPERILAATWQVLDGDTKNGRCPELWDGRASERVVRILRERLGESG
jgi:UDP-N-acetylglucosamine 2-epimerase (non-hydrolysing)